MNLIVAIIWIGLGIGIGCAAAEVKKFPTWQGAIGGALLGILSPLMFLVSSTSKKCKFCMSEMPKAATVCAKCGRDQGVTNPIDGVKT